MTTTDTGQPAARTLRPGERFPDLVLPATTGTPGGSVSWPAATRWCCTPTAAGGASSPTSKTPRTPQGGRSRTTRSATSSPSFSTRFVDSVPVASRLMELLEACGWHGWSKFERVGGSSRDNQGHVRQPR